MRSHSQEDASKAEHKSELGLWCWKVPGAEGTEKAGIIFVSTTQTRHLITVGCQILSHAGTKEERLDEDQGYTDIWPPLQSGLPRWR